MAAPPWTKEQLEAARQAEYSAAEIARGQRQVQRFGALPDVPMKEQVQLACAMSKLLGHDRRASNLVARARAGPCGLRAHPLRVRADSRRVPPCGPRTPSGEALLETA
jgi:hypothetical protein